MLAITRTGLAALLVLVSASEAWAQSRNRAAHRAPARGTAPAYSQPAKPAVKPFTAEEKGWFDRASKVY
jgi:hypothetical protein